MDICFSIDFAPWTDLSPALDIQKSVGKPVPPSLGRMEQWEEQPASPWLLPASSQLLHQFTKLMKTEVVRVLLTT